MVNFVRRVCGGAADTHAGIGAAASRCTATRLIHSRKTPRHQIPYRLIAAKPIRAAIAGKAATGRTRAIAPPKAAPLCYIRRRTFT